MSVKRVNLPNTHFNFPNLPYMKSELFSLVHSDIWGPSCVKIISGMRWFIAFIDDLTRVCWIYLLKYKSDAEKTFKIFHSMIKNQFNTSIKVY